MHPAAHVGYQRDRRLAGRAPFDLMVDDLAATHRELRDAGVSVSAVEQGGIHSSFTVTDPSGTEITVNSTHVMGPV